MRTLILIAALAAATPALAQQEPAPRPLPPGSFQWDGNRKDMKDFAPPSPVVIGDGPGELPPGSFRFDGRQNELRPFGAPPRPRPEPEKKPAKSIG